MRVAATWENLRSKLDDRTTIDPITDCWLWQGAKNAQGYGVIRVIDYNVCVHRASAYMFHNLDITDSKELATHIPYCPNKHCWNPDHIVVGDHRKNANDILITGNYRNGSGGAGKTHCIHGHELEGYNLVITTRGTRECRTCGNRQKAEYKQRKKQQYNQTSTETDKCQ